MAKAPAEDELVEKVFDASQHDAVAEAILKLDPEEAAFFLHKLEAALRKRRIMIGGYLASMFVWAIGMVVAFGAYALVDGSMGYALFFLPFLAVGVVLYLFGWWANRVGARALPVPAASVEPPRPAG